VAKWNPLDSMNPEELGSYAEGDIIMPKSIARNGLKAATSRWPDAVIPYRVADSFSKCQKDDSNF